MTQLVTRRSKRRLLAAARARSRPPAAPPLGLASARAAALGRRDHASRLDRRHAVRLPAGHDVGRPINDQASLALARAATFPPPCAAAPSPRARQSRTRCSPNISSYCARLPNSSDQLPAFFPADPERLAAGQRLRAAQRAPPARRPAD